LATVTDHRHARAWHDAGRTRCRPTALRQPADAVRDPVRNRTIIRSSPKKVLDDTSPRHAPLGHAPQTERPDQPGGGNRPIIDG
jgi:hypothetical protein